MLRRLSLAILLAGSLLPGLAARGAELVPVSPEQSRALGIGTTPVLLQHLGTVTGLPGRVRVPVEQLQVVAAPVAGLVREVHVVSGQAVTKGQLLARLASPDLLMLQRDAAQTRSVAALARQNRDRDVALHEEGIIARSRLQASQATLEQAEAAATQAVSVLAMVGGESAGSAGLRAPMAGVVLEQQAEPGQRVEQATPLFRIGDLSRLWLEIDVPVAMAAGLEPGLAVSVAGSAASGRIIGVGQQVSPAQTILVRALLDRDVGGLKVGQQLAVSIRTATGKDGLWQVPLAAVVRREEGGVAGGQAYVFVARPGGFEPVPVLVAQGGPGTALLRGPLKAGDQVLSRGVAAVKGQWMGIGGAAE